ncbi:hypothetical protein [Pelotomaculum propionicicum]
MNFFCTKEHLEKWAAARGINLAEIFCLDAQEALIVSKMLFELT